MDMEQARAIASLPPDMMLLKMENGESIDVDTTMTIEFKELDVNSEMEQGMAYRSDLKGLEYNIKSANAFVVMSKPLNKARMGRKSFCPAPIRVSSSNFSNSKFRKSTTARLKSRASRANRVSGRRWPFIHATAKWTLSARAWECAASA